MKIADFYNLDLFKIKFKSKTSANSSGCIEWIGRTNKSGYGVIVSKLFPHEQLAHRISYMLNVGFPLSENICVLHKCDNRLCVNPEHLFTGDRDLNNKDRAKKGRTVIHNSLRTKCKRNHEFDSVNTVIRKNGTRLCRKCNNEQSMRRYHESKINNNR